jgi:hypothetical protein
MSTDNTSHKLAPAAKLPSSAVRTPPESPTLSIPGPFPHRICRLFSRIQQWHQGKLSRNTWERVRISPEEYQALQNELGKDTRLGALVTDKLRYDYDSAESEFVLRMPSPLHDIFAIRLQEMIVREFAASMKCEELRPVIERIKMAATSDVRLDNTLTKGKKSPDGSFRFAGTKYPPLVIEIANSQKSDDLSRLAESYIERTKGRTKTVITIDLEYRAPDKRAGRFLPPRTAVYSVYRNRVVRDEQTGNRRREAHAVIQDQHFRMDDSTAPAGSMCLLLSDFCPDGTLSGNNDRAIGISHAELAHLLTEAEREEDIAEAPSSPSSSEKNIPFVSKRKRTSTPKLVSDDEEAFARAETAATMQELAGNSSFSSADAADVVVERIK